MTITATLTIDKAAPNHGDTVTATYATAGNTGTPAVPGASGNLTGEVDLSDGSKLQVSTAIKLPDTPAVPPLGEVYAVPVFAGLTFAATSNPKVFTALVP